jgi:hypothetical protein
MSGYHSQWKGTVTIRAAPVNMNIEGGGTVVLWLGTVIPNPNAKLEIITMHVREQIVKQCQPCRTRHRRIDPFLQESVYIN